MTITSGAYPKGRGFDDHPTDSLGVCAVLPRSDDVVAAESAALVPPRLERGRGTRRRPHPRLGSAAPLLGRRQDVQVHTSSSYEGANGAMTMGYYERADLPFHYALVGAFILSDSYHCSILAPTHPNRLMASSGTIDPAGTHGGPVTDTNSTPDVLWNCTWPTMQEVLEDSGVSW